MAVKKSPVKSVSVVKESYSGKDIQVLDNLEAVRQNMGFYIGGKDTAALTRKIREIVANSVDEILAGHGNVVEVIISGNEVTVRDEGRGIPVDIHPKTKRPTIIDIFSTLHAGGKSKAGTAYTNTVGVHGIGASVVNFLSVSFEAWTFRGSWYHIKFKNGKMVGDLTNKTPPTISGKKPSKGTIVRFTPDFSCFNANVKFNTQEIIEYLKINSYMVPKAQFICTIDGKKTVFQHKNGLKDYISSLLEEHKAESVGKPFIFNCPEFSVALQWSTHSEELLVSYVNGSKTLNGGTHVNGMCDAISKAIAPLKGKRTYKVADLRTGLVAVLNSHVKSPEFSDGQTKSKLGTESAYSQVFNTLFAQLKPFFKTNKTLTSKIINRAVEVGNLYRSFQASKKATSELRSTKNKARVHKKLMTSFTKNPQERELYITEGDSASSNMRDARDPYYQEVLSLKGKFSNPYGSDSFMENEEVQNILMAIGWDGSSKSENKLQVGRIMLMADPDSDGKHISLLLINLFQKIMPKTFLDRKVFVVDFPLFMYSPLKGPKIFADSLEELQGKVTGKFDSNKVTRIKGYGELNAPEVKTIAMDPKTRRLIRLSELKVNELNPFLALVGKDTASRKKLLGIP